MRIYKANRVIRLGRDDTRRWEDAGPDGSEFRSALRRTLARWAARDGKPWEVYASAVAGGWMADHVCPETV